MGISVREKSGRGQRGVGTRSEISHGRGQGLACGSYKDATFVAAVVAGEANMGNHHVKPCGQQGRIAGGNRRF